jgi:hypothetical protein
MGLGRRPLLGGGWRCESMAVAVRDMSVRLVLWKRGGGGDGYDSKVPVLAVHGDGLVH